LSSGERPSQPELFPLPVYHPSDVWRHLNISIFNIVNKYKIDSWFGYLNRSWYPTIFAPVLSSSEVLSQPKLFPLPVFHLSDVWRHLNISIFNVLNKYKIELWFGYLNRSWYPTIFAPVLSSGELPSHLKLFPLPLYHPSDVWRHMIISNFNIFEKVYDRIVIRLPKPKLVPGHFCTNVVVGWAPREVHAIAYYKERPRTRKRTQLKTAFSEYFDNELWASKLLRDLSLN